MKRLERSREIIAPTRKNQTINRVDFWNDCTIQENVCQIFGLIHKGAENPSYVVQTAIKPIERCLLMTSDPGDLVLDPTCGSGTTAFVAEKWGRRWITCDTSRVALAHRTRQNNERYIR